MSVRYRLSRPTKHEASLVAAPDNKSSKPVANGSSVPAWPVRAPVRRRTPATMAKEDGPAGLSTRIRPRGLRALFTRKHCAPEPRSATPGSVLGRTRIDLIRLLPASSPPAAERTSQTRPHHEKSSCARGGTREELALDELGDLLDRIVAREAGRLPVTAATRLPRNRRDVELVVARAQADPARRPVPRLTDQSGHVRALDRA